MRLLKAICLPAILASVNLSINCTNSEDLSSANIDLNEVADQEGFEAVLTTTRHGLLSSQVKYGRMLKFSNKKVTQFLDGIELHLYENGEHSSLIFANEGTLDERIDRFQLSGDVNVFSDNGVNLRTERLFWESKLDTVTSDTFVTIITVAGDTLYGVGFGSGKSFQNWIIEQPRGTTQKRLKLGVADSGS